MGDFYLPSPDSPNRISGYRRVAVSPGPGWIEGPPPKNSSPEWMKYDTGVIVPLSEAEYNALWIEPETQKQASIQEVLGDFSDLPGVALNGTPDEIKEAIQGVLNTLDTTSITNLETAVTYLEQLKSALLVLLPAMGKLEGLCRDLLLYMWNKKNG